MELIITYIILFGIIVVVGQIFNQSTLPISLLLVITGMLLSLIPGIPSIRLNPEVVLNIFLPILIYQISSFSSWVDTKKHIRPIALLSVGHVFFITFLIAYIIHTISPELGWPLAFVLGAIISPPDDVAIVTIAEKIRIPKRIITILEGEGMFNDASALILFRFALVAMLTHQFSMTQAATNFLLMVVGELLYSLILGNVLGQLRVKLSNTMLHIIASILTPFLAYFPAEMLGGSGVLATCVTGFVIGNRYSIRFTPEFRLVSRSTWFAIAFSIQSILFLLVGLNMQIIIDGISSLPLKSLVIYSTAVLIPVIIGRFIWVYAVVYFLPRFLFPSIRKRDPYPPWQFPFVVSWAGMRGGISLAAALSVPTLPILIEGVNSKALLIFLVFVVITATFLLQGLTLPWLIKILKLDQFSEREDYDDHMIELKARLKIIKAVLHWLNHTKKEMLEKEIADNPKLLEEIKLQIQEYRLLKTQLKERLEDHDTNVNHDEKKETMEEVFLLSQILEVERATLLELWRKEQVTLGLRDKLLARIDHAAKRLPE